MSLKVWLPLTGDLNNYGTQSLPNTSVNSFTYGAGKIGQCASGRVAWILPEEILDNAWSVAMWVRPESLGSNNNILFCKNGTAATDCQIYFSIISTTQLNIGVNGPSSSVTATGQTFTLNKWYHVAATYDGQTASVYLNGQLLKSGTVTTEKPTGRLNMNINGRCTNVSNTGSTGHFTGAFNDFRLYNHCLSLSEVREIAQGLILHYKLDGNVGLGNPNLLINSLVPTEGNGASGITKSITDDGIQKVTAASSNGNWVTFGNHNTTLALTKGDTFTFSLMIKSDDSVKKPTVYFQSGLGYYGMQGTMSNEWSIIYYTGTWSIDNLNTNLHLGFSSAPGTYYIKYFKLEKGAQYTPWAPAAGEPLSNLNYIQDSSGYNHNGETVGDLRLINSEGRYRTATYFNCSEPNTNNDNGITYIETPLSLTEPTALTFAWWAKPESGYNGSVAHAAFCTSNSATRPTDYNATAFHHRDSSFDICPVSGSGIRLPLAYTQNQWHHYAVTYDGKTARAYKDGEQTAAVAFSANNALKTFSKLFIGYSQAGGVHRKTLGSYSDFRVYVTALLDNDIKKLYNTSMSVDKAHRTHTFELEEKTANLLFPTENSRIQLEFGHGLSRYTQTNCQVTLTQDGYHIYRPPNLTTADDGNSMYGGLKLVNQSTDSIAEYDSIRDNIWDLQQGHTYLFTCHIEGQSTQGVNFGWTNNMGWGGHGMSPSPTWIINSGVPTNFEGHRDSVCIFTINDEIVKPCTSAYSSYTLNTEYLSYRHFTLNWGYGSTGALGTDLYLTHFQLYDITDKIGQVLKNGIVDFSSFNEEDVENAKIQRSNIFFADGFIER